MDLDLFTTNPLVLRQIMLNFSQVQALVSLRDSRQVPARLGPSSLLPSWGRLGMTSLMICSLKLSWVIASMPNAALAQVCQPIALYRLIGLLQIIGLDQICLWSFHAMLTGFPAVRLLMNIISNKIGLTRLIC